MPSITVDLALAACDAKLALLNAGSGTAQLIVYEGTPPANVTAALGGGNNPLVAFDLPATVFGPSVDGDPNAEAPLLGVPLSAVITGAGDATFARFTDRDGNAKIQVSASADGGGGEIQFDDDTFVVGVTARVDAFTYVHVEGP